MNLKGHPVVEFILSRLSDPDPEKEPIALSDLREIDAEFGVILKELKRLGLEYSIFESPPDSNKFFLEIKDGYASLAEMVPGSEPESATPEAEPEIIRFQAKKLNITKLKGGDIKFSCYVEEHQKELASFIIDADEEIDLLRVEIMRVPEGQAGAEPPEEAENPAPEPSGDEDLDNIMAPEAEAGTDAPEPEEMEAEEPELTPEEEAEKVRREKEEEIRADTKLSEAEKKASLNMLRGYGPAGDAGERSSRI